MSRNTSEQGQSGAELAPGCPDGLTVGRTASLVGVSVRTLHHWDTIGLVRPSGRTPAEYRVYSDQDVARIHRVLVYRELGFPLAEIGKILDDPNADARDHLRRQHAQLTERISRLQTMASAVERMMKASATGMRLTPQQQVDIFGKDWQPGWVEEAQERWGDSEQWAQYADRAAGMTPQDWKKVTATTEQLNADLATAKRTGLTPGTPETNHLAERHRALMSTYFDCTHSMQVCLARRFTDDPGFSQYYNNMEPGLSTWFRDIINANAKTHDIDPETATWT